jgi:hypothetical protein
MRLSDWIIIDEDCAARVLEGTDPEQVRNRVAFIEKSPRVRIMPFTEKDDHLNWAFGPKGSDYGHDEESRAWCDRNLTDLGYLLP